ncbi:nuclear factor NF-kappa-B p110 subunit isoform X2 [Macrosteles quadrilineatus]|uniref:nuclear factor NF-kappa-B p110 subunit isoform X2 n=1 Tax=Macrosteles quadrilineatus TaxID=74068 RepID=UPI0023E0D6BA|nr:nuclear factor NF-kappa-B p110 subunit isoform X2 [Macrosteles quadrilineatus]
MATGMGGASSHGSSGSESEIPTPNRFCEGSNSPMRSPDTTTMEDPTAHLSPYLQMVEPPVESLRFRYPTEMKGTHGSILGISSGSKKSKKTFPSVKICNYNAPPDQKVIIRCTVMTADEDIQSRIPHVHQLKGKGKTQIHKTIEIDDPIDIQVTGPNYQAVFGNMTILFIKKDDQVTELVNKKKRHLQKWLTNPMQIIIFTEDDEKELLEKAQKDVESMTVNRLNTACLKFEALGARIGQPHYTSICQPIYSKPIKNMKNAQFNDLKICRIDKIAGTCLGKEEVFIFVDKVNKKDIKVRFFELDDNKEEIWHADAELNEDDVHFQYAIAFRTPRYRNTDIKDNVQVYFQLERPSNHGRSEPKEFEYTPDPERWRDEIRNRKRPRRSSPPVPISVTQWNMSDPSTSSGDLTSATPTCSENSLSGFSLSDFDILKEFDLSVPFEDFQMEVEPQEGCNIPSSSHSSLQEVLSNIPSGDSDIIKQMITSGNFNEWAKCHGVADTDIARITSEVTSLKDKQQWPLSFSDEFETDGSSSLRVGVETHQMAMGAKLKKKQPPPAAETTGMEIEFEKNSFDQRGLTSNNIVVKVVKVINLLQFSRKTKKITENAVKRYLSEVFGTCVGEVNDRVLHIMSSSEDFRPEMLRFLYILKMYNISQSVLNLKNIEGQTALHVAVERGSLQTIALLVDSGADVNARDINLNTPLHLVANRGQPDICNVIGHLLKKSPDLTIYNKDGLTALHLLVIKRKFDAISSILVKNETERFNSVTTVLNLPERKQGNTALHLAVQYKCLDIVGLLLNFTECVDVNAKNFEDKTPLAYVSFDTSEDLKIEELLLKNKADPLLVHPKISQKSDELKEDDYENAQDEVEMVDDVDESLSAHAQDWKSVAELKLMDKQTISPFCQILDDNRNWLNLFEALAKNHPALFEDMLLHQLSTRWSPTLYLLKFIAKEMPNLTKETLRDLLMGINAECRKAAQFIDDMVLTNMGVF